MCDLHLLMTLAIRADIRLFHFAHIGKWQRGWAGKPDPCHQHRAPQGNRVRNSPAPAFLLTVELHTK